MAPTRTLRATPFNLIEVTMALIIVGVGLISIMALFPIGANATRDTIGDHYSAQTAEEMLGYIVSQVQSGAINLSGSAIPTDLPDISDVDSSDTWNEIEDGFYQLNGSTSVFRIQRKTDSIVDFDAVARIWQSAADSYYYDTSTSTFVASGSDSQINMELSWPIQVSAYPRRTKAFFSTGVSQ